jgi:hypothetical protein
MAFSWNFFFFQISVLKLNGCVDLITYNGKYSNNLSSSLNNNNNDDFVTRLNINSPHMDDFVINVLSSFDEIGIPFIPSSSSSNINNNNNNNSNSSSVSSSQSASDLTNSSAEGNGNNNNNINIKNTENINGNNERGNKIKNKRNGINWSGSFYAYPIRCISPSSSSPHLLYTSCGRFFLSFY